MLAAMEDPMATATAVPNADATRAPAPPPFRPLRALRLLLAVLRDPERTDLVYAFFDAMGGDDGPAHLRAVQATPSGRRLLAERPSLLARLADERLSRLPASTLGGAYVRAMRARGFAPDGLLAYHARGDGARLGGAEQQWLGDRINVMHDLWHVLTGYGTDPLGEAALIAFTHAQIPNRSFPLLLLGAVLRGPKSWDLAWPRYLWRAYERGRHARLLTAAPFEELLAAPLARVRCELRVGEPEEWHPGGVLCGELPA
jgi:ubiquinone biosynthesis protein COQ4